MSRACDYANARISARRALLLGPEGLREVATRGELADQLEVLRRSLWGRALGGDRGDAPRDIPSVERALAGEAAAQRSEVESWIEPASRPIVAAVLLLDAVGELAVLLRGVARGEQADAVLQRYVPAPELPPDVARSVAAAPNLAGAAAALESAGSALAPVLAAALPAAASEPAQLHLEVAMQRAGLAVARGIAAASGRAGRALAAALALHVDHLNAATLLSVESAAHAKDLHLEGGRMGRADFARLAALPPAERIAPLAAFVSPIAFGRRVDPGDLATPGAAEQRLAGIRERALHAAARAMPLGTAVPLAWLVAVRCELRRIRVVLRATAFGMPSEELLDLVEA